MASYWSAFGYLGSVVQALTAINAYQQHRDESELAEALVEILLSITGSAGVPCQEVVRKVGEIVELFEGKVD